MVRRSEDSWSRALRLLKSPSLPAERASTWSFSAVTVVVQIAWKKSFLERPPTRSYGRRDARCSLFRFCGRDREKISSCETDVDQAAAVGHGLFGVGSSGGGLCVCSGGFLAGRTDGHDRHGVPAGYGS